MIRIKPLIFGRQAQYFSRVFYRDAATYTSHGDKVTIHEAVKKIDNLLTCEARKSSYGSHHGPCESSSVHYEGVQGNLITTKRSYINQELSQLPEGFQGEEYDTYGCMSIGTIRLGGISTGTLTAQSRSLHTTTLHNTRLYCTEPPKKESTATVDEANLSQTDKLKRAVKEYGATVMVFHVGISLISLGSFYLAVSSGVDMVGILAKMGVGESILESKAVAGAGTFVVAYAVHKVFAPVRIAITLTSTPFIVRYLRRIGFLKPPKPTL